MSEALPDLTELLPASGGDVSKGFNVLTADNDLLKLLS